MFMILYIAGEFVVYAPARSGRPVYRAFATIEDAVAFRAML